MNARKSARNVPSTISRLLKSNAFLKSPPPAYYPLLAHPPAPSLVRSLPARPIQDLPASLVDPSLQPYQSHRAAERKRQGVKEQSKDTMEEIMVKATRRRPPRAANTKRSQPLPIVFAEDELRRQFFRDHPFEAYRPVFLAESESVQGPPGPSGAAWTALSQRTTIPTAEDCIAFTLNLHVHSEGGIPLPLAYTTAATQFRTLRAEHETANRSATLQAQSHGATFFSEIDRAVLVEGRVLDGWSRAKEIQAEIAASKGQGGRPGAPAPTAAPAPSSIFTKPGETTDSEVMELGEVEFTGGVEYVTRFARRGLEDEQVEEESEDGDDVDAVAGSTK